MKKIDTFNKILCACLYISLGVILSITGLINFIGNDTYIRIGSFSVTLKLKWLLFIAIFLLNGYLHEWIHVLTGKIVIPGAKFNMNVGLNRAQTKRIGGDPTRMQDQIFTIMPFVLLSVVTFFVGLAVKDYTDLPMYFVYFNTPGSIHDIEVFLALFCYPKDMTLSQIHTMHTDLSDCKNWYHRFWLKWDMFFSE